MNSKPHPSRPRDIEEVLAQKEQTLEQIRTKGACIHRLVDELFTPPKATNRYEAMLNNVGRAVAIYDGIMVGVKLMRRFRHVLKR